ncbi:MAG TPA: NAD-dependent succinate-semialdehyde dehydrogenase [Xanthobacteraceae bacterium]|nr:NAD-dependent succinate-semialdehyde dehydrogenase [Xanthobacteraceae bacterium]
MNAKYGPVYLWIDGQRLNPAGRQVHEVIDPSTGEKLADLPLASKADLDLALEAADRAFASWKRTSPVERSNILRKAAALLRERIGHIATQLTLEEGKTIAESRIEVMTCAEVFEWCAEEGRRTYGRLIPPRQPGVRQIVLKEPVGPVAAFAPWNFPGITPARKIAAAIAAGCSIIIKPAEETPSTALCFAEALHDAGLPKGVLNVVFGVPSEVSTYLLASPVIRKLSFTGSTAVGKQLAKLAADGVKRATMELGGHAPVIVCNDIDVDKVVPLALASKFRNAGQVCISPTRFHVQEGIFDRFVETFSNASKALNVTNGLDDKSQMGSLANPRRVSAMETYIADAEKHGGKISAGGRRKGNTGMFWEPTVISDVPHSARIMNEEPFGAVAVFNRFSKLDEAIAEANRLPLGLAAYAFTNDLHSAKTIEHEVQAGMIGLNTFMVTLPETPFGGQKDSGYGSEGGIEGIDGYMQTKYVSEV